MQKIRRPSSKSYKIGLLLSEKAEYGRGVLRGIANFAKDYPHWHFRVEPPEVGGLKAMAQWQPDGMIVMLNRKELVPKLLAFKVPMVNVCQLPGEPDAQLVKSDDAMVARLGAEHLLERRAATYGFVGLAPGEYVEIRGKTFADTICKTGASCRLFYPMGRDATRADQIALQKWLQECPKPLAIMACNDHSGRLVLETCRHANLQIPDDVAVLGVDNEDPLSRLVWPGLSSITLPTDQIGQNASSLLNKLLSGQALLKAPFLISPLGVVVRGSTRQLALSDPILMRVISAIHESTGVPLSVPDLLRLVPISRVSLEKRFRRALGRTPLQEIRRARISQARQLLAATDLPLKAISERCGYAAPSRLIESFQIETGQSPSEYRAQIWLKERTSDVSGGGLTSELHSRNLR
jgi:LacI family transcriptional regulator